MEFRAFDKVPRLNREMTITEKIDGTNASIYIEGLPPTGNAPLGALAVKDNLWMVAGSRTRWISPTDDNFGFARWARDNADDLFNLGPGHHFGEWWGSGIQRGYMLPTRRFSLFNVGRWHDESAVGVEDLEGRTLAPSCCHVVPVLLKGLFDSRAVTFEVDLLRQQGSVARPGYMNPEGVIVWHDAAHQMFKVTLKDDEKPKSKTLAPVTEAVAA